MWALPRKEVCVIDEYSEGKNESDAQDTAAGTCEVAMLDLPLHSLWSRVIFILQRRLSPQPLFLSRRLVLVPNNVGI
jgi:hypothetical protein